MNALHLNLDLPTGVTLHGHNGNGPYLIELPSEVPYPEQEHKLFLQRTNESNYLTIPSNSIGLGHILNEAENNLTQPGSKPTATDLIHTVFSNLKTSLNDLMTSDGLLPTALGYTQIAVEKSNFNPFLLPPVELIETPPQTEGAVNQLMTTIGGSLLQAAQESGQHMLGESVTRILNRVQ